MAGYRNVADKPDLIDALDRALIELANCYGVSTGHLDWEYLLTVAAVA